MKNYLFYSFKKKLPLFIIIAVIFLSIALLSISTVDFINTFYIDGGERMGYWDTTDAGYLGTIISLFSFMLFLPFFGMNYRYSLKKSDTFRQVAFKERSIRWGEHLTTLITVLIIWTIAYAILVGGLAIKNFSTVAPPPTEYNEYEVIYFNFIYYVPLYFAAIGLATAQYFVSYLLISRSNNFLNSLITLGVGECFLLSIIALPLSFVYESSFSLFGIATNASVFFPISYLEGQFNDLITRGVDIIKEGFFPYEMTTDVIVKNIGFIASWVIFIGTAIVGIVAFIFEKDPSSEWAGKPNTDKPYQEIVYHAGIGVLSGYIVYSSFGLETSPFAIILAYVLISSTYYTIYGLLHRNFKLKLRQTLTLVGVMTFIILCHVAKIIYEVVVTASNVIAE